jgi:nitrate reductase beta subunit
MAQDFYDTEEASETAVAVAPGEEEVVEETAEETVAEDEPLDESESPVEVVSKSFFMGKPVKPGYRCEVEVTKVDEDSVLIKKISDSEKSEDGENMMGDEMMGEETETEDFYA